MIRCLYCAAMARWVYVLKRPDGTEAGRIHTCDACKGTVRNTEWKVSAL